MRKVVITLNNRSYLADAFGGADRIPRHAVTLGLTDFVGSKRALVLAFGESKARVIAQMVEGPVTAMAPCSVLQMHSRVDLIVDEPASPLRRLSDDRIEAVPHLDESGLRRLDPLGRLGLEAKEALRLAATLGRRAPHSRNQGVGRLTRWPLEHHVQIVKNDEQTSCLRYPY